MGAATRTFAAVVALACALLAASPAGAASSATARKAVKVTVQKKYGAAGLTVRVSCKRYRRDLYTCNYVAPARTRETMIFWGNATVSYRGRRAKVRLMGGGCLGKGCGRSNG